MDMQNTIRNKGHDITVLDTVELRDLLENVFESTFVDELIPGILHNFANPLNGIMGRAQILQRRLNETIAKMGVQYPEAANAFADMHKKLVTDVASICQESDRFYNMFQDVSGKLYAIGSDAVERINLSRLVASELRFNDYYLDFKHEIMKELSLNESLPEINGIASYYSLCFWSLFRYAMVRMRTMTDKTLFVATSHDDTYVSVTIGYEGLSLTETESDVVDRILSGKDIDPADPAITASYYYLSLCLLKKMGSLISIRKDGAYQETVIKVAY
jgi:hypothetical protein